MIIDAAINDESITVQVDNPFRLDMDSVINQIERFADAKGAELSGLDLKRLIPGMIKGIAGCEKGCPANAKGLVSRGFDGFDLKYVEGGILSARSTLKNGGTFELKMFPDF
jgi:hypothetical protein